MKGNRPRFFRGAAIATFVLGLSALIVAQHADTYAKVSPAPVGFTMTQNQMFVPADETEPVLDAVRIRYQHSDGRFKLVTTYLGTDGSVERVTKVYREPQRGGFIVSEERKALVSLDPGFHGPLMFSESSLRESSRLQGEARVLGRQALVLRTPNAIGSEPTDYYHALDLGGFPIKEVHVKKHGRYIIEPTEVIPGEPSDSVFDDIPDYPLSYDYYLSKIERHAKVRPDLAEKMRQRLSLFQEQQKRELHNRTITEGLSPEAARSDE